MFLSTIVRHILLPVQGFARNDPIRGFKDQMMTKSERKKLTLLYYKLKKKKKR